MQHRKPWFCQDCRVLMKYDQKDDCHKCPECGAALWYPDEPRKRTTFDKLPAKDKKEIAELMEEKQKANEPSRNVPIALGGAIVLGGGNKSGRNKKVLKKDSVATVNRKLFLDT